MREILEHNRKFEQHREQNQKNQICNLNQESSMPMIVDKLTLREIHSLYKTDRYVNIIELNSVDVIINEDTVRLGTITDEKIKGAFKEIHRLILYKRDDSNEPNTVKALEIAEETNTGLYKCNTVKIKYTYSRNYGRQVKFICH